MTSITDELLLKMNDILNGNAKKAEVYTDAVDSGVKHLIKAAEILEEIGDIKNAERVTRLLEHLNV